MDTQPNFSFIMPSRDDATELAKLRCKRFKNTPERKACLQAYLARKAHTAVELATLLPHEQNSSCPTPSDTATPQERLRLDQCLHESEKGQNFDLLYSHILKSPVEACAEPPFEALSSEMLRECLLHAGDAKWMPNGLVDVSGPECTRRWMHSGCVRQLFAGVDALFIGNSVIRRQMYTVIDLLAGPAARRLQGTLEIVPTPLSTPDLGVLTDPALRTQEGILNVKVRQQQGTAWRREALRRTRMWDRDGEQNAYHAAQLVTVDLHTGEQRFHLPHRMCQLSDAFMKLHTGRLEQFRKPTLLKPGWRRTKWAGREWRPMVSFRLHGLGSGASGAATPSTTPMGDCAPPSLFMGATRPWHDGSAEVRTTRSRVLDALRHHLEAVGATARAAEWLPNVTVHIESGTTTVPSVRPSEAGLTTAHLRAAFGAGAVEAGGDLGLNVWVLFPTYHGERERFNGYCEDRPSGSCECTGVVGDCSHRLCRGKKLCKLLPPTSAHFVDLAQSFASDLSRRGRLPSSGGSVGRRSSPPQASSSSSSSTAARVDSVTAAPFYDDCWDGRGRCQGRRPCLEPGDQMLFCRATAMLCARGDWAAVLVEAKQWIPAPHPKASFLYLFDGASQDAFDETFRTWSPLSVGFGASPIIFGPQFASVRPRQLNISLQLIATAVRHADSCSGGGRSTALIFRSPAFNLDPVNTYKQQANFQRRVRPMVEAAGGITFLDFYTATRDAALQNTPHAIRFDHFSTFHYFDAGRYLQAQTLLHALKLLNTLGSTGTAVPVTLGGG